MRRGGPRRSTPRLRSSKRWRGGGCGGARSFPCSRLGTSNHHGRRARVAGAASARHPAPVRALVRTPLASRDSPHRQRDRTARKKREQLRLRRCHRPQSPQPQHPGPFRTWRRSSATRAMWSRSCDTKSCGLSWEKVPVPAPPDPARSQ